MSAFPESGRSITPENVEIKVRFRPEADVSTLLRQAAIHYGVVRCSRVIYGTRQLSI